jgi:hypothetical protein
MAQPKPSAAQALYGHLPSAVPALSTQRQPKSLANALWPTLAPPKPPPPKPRGLPWSEVDPRIARRAGLVRIGRF